MTVTEDSSLPDNNDKKAVEINDQHMRNDFLQTSESNNEPLLTPEIINDSLQQQPIITNPLKHGILFQQADPEIKEKWREKYNPKYNFVRRFKITDTVG